MPNLSEYTDIKKKIVKLIVNDRDCVDLISNTTAMALPATGLIQTPKAKNQIHMYNYQPGVSEEAKSHVCIEVFDGKIINGAVAWYEVDISISILHLRFIVEDIVYKFKQLTN